MSHGGRKKNFLLSKIYAFKCGKASFREDHSQIGGPGFSRVVYCNDPECIEAGISGYGGNYVSTTKYTLATFVPKSLFEQFRRVANIYFLVVGFLSFTPLAPYSAVSAILPLLIVIGATMVKEAVEDWRRFKQDVEVNNRKVKVHRGDGTFDYTAWKSLRVGDIVKVEKDNFFPADLLMLSSSYEDAICYVETTNLDGETNLKLKQGLEVTSNLQEDSSFQNFKALVKCEDPNANLYSFVGSFEFEGNQHPLSFPQLLLRDSKLRNTDYIYGAVIFTGEDTKVIQNSTDPPSKRSTIERKMDKIVYFLFSMLVVMSTVGSIAFGITTEEDLKDNGRMKRWYLRPDDTTVFFDPDRASLAAFLHFLTAMMLFGYLIPISLYVSIEIVKVLQSIFINQDIHMYDEESDKPAQARTSNLNEELGQVDTILSDKTGTLTCNSMEFVKCSIAGTSYGYGITEVERAMARRKGSPIVSETQNGGEQDDPSNQRAPVKGFNFKDDRILNGNWVNEPHSDTIQKFFHVLAICHTAIPEMDEGTGKIVYQAESPDEAAFVVATREVGFEFTNRTQTSISLLELDPVTGRKLERSYKLLNSLEFDSSRKRMSVIVRDEEGRLLLLCKGADSVMFERLGENGRQFEHQTKEHLNEYADAGLRTLVITYRELYEEEYRIFEEEISEAKNSVSADRDERIAEVAEKIETDLILLGATAVEDKLQHGVPQCIDKLAQAGIKIWVLTGDKMETAINIGFACSLLRQGMKQIIITLDTPEIMGLEKQGDKEAIIKASKASILHQINEGKSELTSSVNPEAHALIIDGKSLSFALEDDMKRIFLELAIVCASVICCRSSPKQKALVTRLVKDGTGRITLGVGDGANDVGMLQEADIGVGISGVEGMQAVMASDFAIAQFRFLERLLLVHGHWCYRRISLMVCYFFYKNIAFGFTLFLFEAYASFSGQAAYNDWYMSLYNVFFTSLPVLALGVFDQDVSARFCLKFPVLYQEGVQNVLFSWLRIISWMFNGVYSAIMIFFFCIRAFEHQSFRKGGEVAGMEVLGATMYTCVVWVVNSQMALAVSYFTLIQHIFIWGGVAIWYLFLMAYGAITPTISTTAYRVFIEACAPAPSFWLLTLFVVITTLIPFFAYAAIQVRFFPMYHQMIQWIRSEGQADDPEFCDMVRQRSIRPTTVGFTARLEARSRKQRDEADAAG